MMTQRTTRPISLAPGTLGTSFNRKGRLLNRPKFANEWYSIQHVAELFDMSPSYIRKLETIGVVHPDRTAGAHRRYSPQDLESIRAHLGKGTTTRTNECLVYVRSALGNEYSSHSTRDIDGQLRAIHDYAQEHGLIYRTERLFQDRSLAMDFSARKGLASLLRTIPHEHIDRLLVTSKARLGVVDGGILESFCALFGVEIIEVAPDEPIISVEILQEFKQFLGYFFREGLKVDLGNDDHAAETFRRLQNTMGTFVSRRAERAEA